MSESASKSTKRPKGLLKTKKAARTAESDEGRSSKRLKIDNEASADISVDSTEKTDVTLQDWEDLKELFENSLEAMEGDDPVAAAPPLLRGILHECDRFIRHHADPATVYTSSGDSKLAFATIHASAVFAMGRIMAIQPEITAPGEPKDASSWFEAAITLFESAIGDDDDTAVATESDKIWRARFEYSWGLAILERYQANAAQKEEDAEDDDEDEGEAAEKAHKIIDLAARRLSKAVQYLTDAPSTGDTATPKSRIPLRPAQTLINSAETLHVTIDSVIRKYGNHPELSRTTYLYILDNLLSPSPFEDSPTTTDDERWDLTLLRAKCWFSVGEGYMEQCEVDLTGEDETTLNSAHANAGLEAFIKARGLFNTVLELPSTKDEDDISDVKILLGECLLGLANVTEDDSARDTLYSDARALGVNIDELEMDE
ncbi:hypothetical protein FRB90_006418 [Tulasnella sp. 427]|nr:hypothetical protein FRB90_006418 [Tulasnella sp. 427]